jgi:hypothetical protein
MKRRLTVPIVLMYDYDEYCAEYGQHFTLLEVTDDLADRIVDAVNWDLRNYSFKKDVIRRDYKDIAFNK